MSLHVHRSTVFSKTGRTLVKHTKFSAAISAVVQSGSQQHLGSHVSTVRSHVHGSYDGSNSVTEVGAAYFLNETVAVALGNKTKHTQINTKFEFAF